MRIISHPNSCGNIYDLPYESVSVVKNGNRIMVRPLCSGLDPIEYAKYSTLEKAEIAMQKLHECYTGGLFLMKNVSIPEGEMEKTKNMTSGFITVYDRNDDVKIEPMNMVFRFPQEDEL